MNHNHKCSVCNKPMQSRHPNANISHMSCAMKAAAKIRKHVHNSWKKDNN